MINITWGNLMPPRCSQAYIVNFLLAPSFFNNPDLGKSIQESSFYQRKDGTILDALNNVKAFRSRLFNFGDSPKTSEKLINLLLLKNKQDNIAYTLDTFPIRHEFKKQWKFFLKEYFGDQYSIYLEDYKKYIHLFLEDNYTIEDFEAEADTDFFKRVKSDRRDFLKNKITIPYHGNEIPLGKLLHSIEAADYSKSPFLDERNSSDISSEDNLFFERLSTLSILACVWIIFAKVEEKENKQITSERKDKKNVYAELIVRLAPMIFPTETVNTLFYTTPENDGSDFIADTFEIPSEKTDTAEARKMLAPVPGYINAKAFTEAGELCEQVVDSVSDVGSIKLATRIRELTIRKSVLDGRINSYSKKNFIIAVHCTDPDYAGLSKDLIIPKETEHANKWFNNYNFIPFASIADLYSWDQLNGGVIEEISQCVHLQYCQSSQQKDACYENLKSYFERLYNRDSSFSAAVSMPYRLFEAGITPTPDWSSWDIQDPDAWWNPETRSHMAETYLEKLTDTSVTDAKNEHPSFHQNLVEQLAKYEQMRWCCYQLTRGWLPVEPSQVLQYINSGVSRHTLQIAKLHPCICSWNDLKTLQEILSDEAKREICTSKNIDTLSKEELIPLLNPKFAKYFSYEKDYSYFQKLNYENIEKTADILTNQWHTDQAF